MNQVWEYKVEKFRDNSSECEDRLNELGTEGWEFCGRQGVHMILKRIKDEPSVDEISASFIQGEMMDRLEFRECDNCAKKPGSPVLCGSCIHNRGMISVASREIKRLNSVIKLVEDLVKMER